MPWSLRLDAVLAAVDDPAWEEAIGWAGAFIASFASPQTRRAYQRDLHCWFAFCTLHHLHPYTEIRRTHIELYLRAMEAQDPTPSHGTMYRGSPPSHPGSAGLKTRSWLPATPPPGSTGPPDIPPHNRG